MSMNLSNAAAPRSAGALSEYTFADLLRLEWLAAAAMVLRMAGAVGEWQLRVAGRRALARMTAREWRDIGLTRGDVLMEVRKSFWNA